jgi:hypothetical protein
MQVSFPYGTSGKTDAPYSFGVKAFDASLNSITRLTETEIIKQKIGIEWPIVSESENTHTVAWDESNKVYKVTVKASRFGTYKIKSSLISGSAPTFSISAGAPS